MSKISITLGLPTIGVMRHQAVESLVSVVGSGLIDAVNIVPRLPTHQARTRIVETTNTTHLLFVDDDMVYGPQQVSLLKAHAEAGKMVVAGLCNSRTDKKIRPVVFEWVPHNQRFTFTMNFDQDRAQVVDGAHVAFTLIDMEVFKGTGKQFVFGKDPYFGEDIDFMHRLREAGVPTWLEPRCKVGHLTDRVL